jgi:aminoglycoside phosphotransferase (APT) family kinase protein
MMRAVLDKDALARFLAAWDPAFGDPARLDIAPMSGGVSNLTYRVRARDRLCVVRRAPDGTKAKTAHDMVREARILQAVRPHFPYCPEVYAICDDPEVLGERFFVMELLDGVVPGRDMPVSITAAQASALCAATIDLHAELHAVDIDATGLLAFGKPEGYVARQIRGWATRYTNALTDDVPTCERIIDWLSANQPSESGACLIHNDFKLNNLVLDPSDPTLIVGVLDWEMATIGDPLMDLGASLAYWIERQDPPHLQALRSLPTTLPGMLTREQVIARYLATSGRSCADFTFYEVYGLFRLAGIVQQIHLRYRKGQTHNPKFAAYGDTVKILAARAEALIQ